MNTIVIKHPTVLLELTNPIKGKIAINLAHVAAMIGNREGTLLYITGERIQKLRVKEKYSEIMEALSGYRTYG